MEEKSGLVTGVNVLMVKTAPEVIEAIAARTGIDAAKVKAMMRYNVFSIGQFVNLSGLAESTIRNKIRPTKMDKATGTWLTELNFCYPFQDNDGDSPLFIFRDAKSEQYIKA